MKSNASVYRRGTLCATLLVVVMVFMGVATIPSASAQDRTPVEPAQARTGLLTPIAASERAVRREALRQSLGRSVAAVEAQLAKDTNASETTRDLSNAALAHLLLDGDAVRAEALLRRVLDAQIMDPKAADFGAIPWQTSPSDVHDDNSIEFGTQAWGPLLIGYGKQLSPGLHDDLTTHARAGFAALNRHKVKVSYTNIFLMKTVCLILMGEAVGDDKIAASGYDLLDQWLNYTRQYGIREFDSPTYYSVGLNSLVNGYRYAHRDGAKAKFGQALNFFWADICAHYFAGREELAGPHSRDYDFLRGGGGVELYLYAEGMKEYTKGLGGVDLEKVYLALNEEPGGYHPTVSLLALASTPERIVEARWDTGASQTTYTYLTPNFALGSTSTNYGPQDKMVNLLIASTKDLPNITVVADDSDAPYGKKTARDSSGHSKPHHLQLNPVAVQNRGTLLLLTDVQGGKRAAPDATSLATNILLPARADAITVNGVPIAVGKPFTHPVAGGDVIGVRAGRVGVALRIVRATGLDGQKPTLVLQADTDGLRYGVARLTAYHAHGSNSSNDATSAGVPNGDALTTILLLVADCPTDADYAALQKRIADALVTDTSSDENIRNVTARIGPDTLMARYDRKTRKPLARDINGKSAEPSGLLTVNGREVGVPLLQ